MCLRAIVGKQIADRDIYWFKVLIQCFAKDIKWQTPCQGTNINDDVIQGKEFFEATGNEESGPHLTILHISRGFIHMFTDINIAEDFASYCHGSVFECYIPKGTEYYIGLDDDICAKKIKFTKKAI